MSDHPMANVEELQQALAEHVIWLRSEGGVCPFHPWVQEWIGDAGGSSEPPGWWRGPSCMCTRGDDIDCDWRDRRDELLASAYEILGTKDMRGFTT